MDIRWARSARADIFSIADHYAQIDPDLAELMLDRLAEAAEPLRDHPRAGPLTGQDIRKWRVRGTPYLLLYRVFSGRVEIVRVRHGASDWIGEF